MIDLAFLPMDRLRLTRLVALSSPARVDFSCLLFGAGLAVAVSASDLHAQTLTELYEAARGYDATYLAERSLRDASLAQANQAHAGLLPQAGLAAVANWARQKVSENGGFSSDSTTKNDNQSATISISQPLYRPINKLTHDQATLTKDISQAKFEQAEQDLIIRVAQGYFDVLAARDTVTFLDALKSSVVEQLASAKRNFEVGTSTITDTHEAQARYDLVQAQEIEASNDLRVKSLALVQLTGVATATPLSLSSAATLPEFASTGPNAPGSKSPTEHPAAVQALRNLEIAQLETRKAEAGHKPTLDLVGQYRVSRGPMTSFFTTQTVKSSDSSIGIQFNLPLFAGLAVQNRVRETLSLEEKARTDLTGTIRSVELATRSAHLGVISGRSQIKALEAAQASSESALESNLLGYQVGVRINVDVLNAQSQLFQTKRDLAQARYNVLLGQLRLRQAMGDLSALNLLPIDSMLTK